MAIIGYDLIIPERPSLSFGQSLFTELSSFFSFLPVQLCLLELGQVQSCHLLSLFQLLPVGLHLLLESVHQTLERPNI